MTDAIPKLEYTETEAGIRQVATRGPGNLRISDWSFPNANHILTPGRTKDAAWVHRGVWSVPVDDTHTYKGIYAIASVSPEEDRATVEHFEKYGDYNPADHHDELFLEKKWPQDPSLQLTPAQDYVAMMGQGSIVEGTREHWESPILASRSCARFSGARWRPCATATRPSNGAGSSTRRRCPYRAAAKPRRPE